MGAGASRRRWAAERRFPPRREPVDKPARVRTPAPPGRRHSLASAEAQRATASVLPDRPTLRHRHERAATLGDRHPNAPAHQTPRGRTNPHNVRPRTTAANCHLIDQDLIDKVLNDSDGARTHAPTLADVAEHLGVSRTTVSNAYNRPDQLSPALREKVLAAAGELGYTGPGPDGALAAAREDRHRSGSSSTSRCATCSPTPPRRSSSPASPPARGAGTGADAHPAAARGRAPSSCARRSSTATSCSARPRTTSASRRSARAACRSCSSSTTTTAPRVKIDDEAAPRAAAQHLVDLGHRDIGDRPGVRDGATDVVTATEVSDPTRTELALALCSPHGACGGGAGRRRGGVDWAGVPVGSAPGATPSRRPRRGRAARPRRPPDRDPLPLRRPGHRRHARRGRARDRRAPRPQRRRLRRHPAARDAPASRPSPSRTRRRAGRPSACSPPAARTRPAADRARRPRLERTRPELNTPERSPAMFDLAVISTQARDLSARSSPPAAAPAAPKRRRRARPRPRAPQRRARPAHARRPPRAGAALRAAVRARRAPVGSGRAWRTGHRHPAHRRRHRLGDRRPHAARGGLRRLDPARRARADPPYHRPPASKGYLRGEHESKGALVHAAGWWERARRRAADAHERDRRSTPPRAPRKLSTKEEVGFDQRAGRDRRDGPPPVGRRRPARRHPLPPRARQRRHASAATSRAPSASSASAAPTSAPRSPRR